MSSLPVLNVIRMIKLFGWESHVAGQVDGRRAAELKLLRKSRYMELLNNLTKYVRKDLDRSFEVILTDFFAASASRCSQWQSHSDHM